METALQGYSAAERLRRGNAADVRAALLAARARTLALADVFEAGLSKHGMRIPYRTTLNPPLWEWGHIGWFQEYWVARNRQRSAGIGCDPEHARKPSIEPHADSWYDSSRVAHATRWNLPLPDAPGTREYLSRTLQGTLAELDALPARASPEELYFFRLCALHEEMHAEAATYMAVSLGIALPDELGAQVSLKAPEIVVPAQVFSMGSSGPGFAFDNELAAHEVSLETFRIDAQPVSWGAFHRFVESGGYRQKQWWTGDGWAWVETIGHTPPLRQDDRVLRAATHLTAYEVDAWCRWAGRRLPTEAEWECAAITSPAFEWGHVWEWTSSPFQPYPGFEPHPYRDYSQPWFGTRRVLRGACPATAQSLAHPRYRNFFEPHRRDIFAGFRTCPAG